MAPKQVSAIRRKHRSVGAALAVFILFMVLSGITINHTDGLGLAQRHVSNPYLLEHYGINTPAMLNFPLAGNWLSLAGSKLYFNTTAVTDIASGIGAVATEQWLVVAGRDELILLDRMGRLVERINWQQPGVVEAIGLTADERVMVISTSGAWLADVELLAWQQVSGEMPAVQWASAAAAPDTLQQAVTRHYRGDGLSVERLLLDLHSGRIFGPLGVLMYDLLALATGFLALSGLVLWSRNRRKGKTR